MGGTRRPSPIKSVNKKKKKKPIDVGSKFITPKPNLWALAFMALAGFNFGLLLRHILN